MPDTVYEIKMQSPMGIKKGLAQVCLQDGRIVLKLLGGENFFSGSIVPEYAFQMTGALQTAVGAVPGCLRGTFSKDGLRAVLCTEQGDFPIEGVLDSREGDTP